LLLVVVLASALQFKTIAQSELDKKNELVIAKLHNGQFKSLHKSFGADLKKSVKSIQLRMIWLGITKTMGEYSDHGKPDISEKEGIITYNTALYFEEGSLQLKLGFTDNMISAIWISPRDYVPPSKTLGVAYGKERMTIGHDTFQLPAEVIIPRSCRKCPLVVLVHGSGPNDMDEAMGPNKVFKDISMMLALEGIATLRYDKRSKVYPELFQKGESFTIQEETVLDAQDAIKQARNLDYIDSSRVYVLGHSLGAYAAPLIVSSDDSIAGAIMMAGPERSIVNLLSEQYEYIYGLDEKITGREKKQLKKIKLAADQVRSLPNPKLKKLKTDLGYWPIDFYRDINGYLPSNIISKTETPFLILQGVQDYQVSYERDYKLLEERLKGKENVSFQFFSKLDHLMMYSEDFSKPVDYFSPRNVSEDFVGAVSNWIKR